MFFYMISQLRLKYKWLVTDLTCERSITNMFVNLMMWKVSFGVKALMTNHACIDVEFMDSMVFVKGLFTLKPPGAVQAPVGPVSRVWLNVFSQVVLASKPLATNITLERESIRMSYHMRYQTAFSCKCLHTIVALEGPFTSVYTCMISQLAAVMKCILTILQNMVC